MALSERYLPRPTPLDDSTEPPSSVDPLGTQAHAERIADVLLPGLTARMWRPRFLTFVTVATRVAEGAKEKLNRWDDDILDARLAFERLFVSALVRQDVLTPGRWKAAVEKLPGKRLATAAFRANDTPLGTANFIDAQASNGPYGVMARLARHTGILDDADALGRHGEELLQAWAADNKLGDLERAPQIKRWVDATVALVDQRNWKSRDWPGWKELAWLLRPDAMGRRERTVLQELLDADPIRSRCFELLSKPKSISVYLRSADGERTRNVLLKAVKPALAIEKYHTDRVIAAAIELADAYETVASYFQTAFDCVRWILAERNSRATPNQIADDKQRRLVFRSLCNELPGAARCLRAAVERGAAIAEIAERDLAEPLEVLAVQAETAAASPLSLIETVLDRHRDVQKSKGTAMWIHPGERWTLMPGFAHDEQGELPYGRYLHTFRVENAFSFLKDLGSGKSR